MRYALVFILSFMLSQVYCQVSVGLEQTLQYTGVGVKLTKTLESNSDILELAAVIYYNRDPSIRGRVYKSVFKLFSLDANVGMGAKWPSQVDFVAPELFIGVSRVREKSTINLFFGIDIEEAMFLPELPGYFVEFRYYHNIF